MLKNGEKCCEFCEDCEDCECDYVNDAADDDVSCYEDEEIKELKLKLAFLQDEVTKVKSDLDFYHTQYESYLHESIKYKNAFDSLVEKLLNK
jgi:molecular chaperone GrpE (heat shock protein)